MANEWQVADLKEKGAEAWNADRKRGLHSVVDLSGANLIEADLRGVNLRGGRLDGADLSGADLSGAELNEAELSEADLRAANLIRADLRGASLGRANFVGADLSRANLSNAKLTGADLRGANLIGANLSKADLARANLIEADLRGANLIGANLHSARLPPGFSADKVSTAQITRNTVATGTPAVVRDSIERLGTADTKDVQQIAASQLELLTAYHQVALGQSDRSFFWALIGSGVGLLLFFVAGGVAFLTGLNLASIVPLIAGAVVEVISGVVFYLYGQTSLQLSAFHSRLEVLQRYLLANSICEGLSETERDKARAALIGEISHPQPTK